MTQTRWTLERGSWEIQVLLQSIAMKKMHRLMNYESVPTLNASIAVFSSYLHTEVVPCLQITLVADS